MRPPRRAFDWAIKHRWKEWRAAGEPSSRGARTRNALLSCIGTLSTRAYGRSSGNLYCLRLRKSSWRLPILFTGRPATQPRSGIFFGGGLQEGVRHRPTNARIYRSADDRRENNAVDNGQLSWKQDRSSSRFLYGLRQVSLSRIAEFEEGVLWLV